MFMFFYINFCFVVLKEINKILGVLYHTPTNIVCCFMQILAKLRGSATCFGPPKYSKRILKLGYQIPSHLSSSKAL
jgi:hypothetical protein